MKRSIFLKTFGGYLLIIVLLVALVLITAFGYIGRRFLDNQAADQVKMAWALEPTVAAYLDRNALVETEAFFRRFEKQNQVRLTLIRPDGTVLADSQENPERMENHRFRPEVVQALEGRVGRSLRFSDTLRAEMLYIALPLFKEGRVVALLRVSTFVRDIDLTMAGLKRRITETALLITALALVLAFFITRGYTRPIRKMIEASKRIAGGDFEAKVYLRSRDELGQLGASLNAMNDRIRTLFSEVTAQREEIQGILGSMEEGLLVVEPDERIGLANPSFGRMFPVANPAGKYYWEVLRNSKLSDLVERSRREKKSQLDRITLQERTYLVHASYIPNIDQVVLTVHDITDMASLERLKKDLIANVSHELQTPLTSIKGYAETLEADANGTGLNYLKIILRNTDRLIAIVRDLLLLSELEDTQDKASAPPFEPVDLKSLVANILKIFDPKARDKGLTLAFEAAPGPTTVTGDAFRLEQMIINLLDNAVKYTEKGGVTIRLAADKGSAVLEVVDTGVGIPEEHLPRLFERFYVVDKSRSRSLGGTGLGLSIVKHIVLMHRGEISVKSELGRGTTFSVRLPLLDSTPPAGSTS
jgi:two-component system phosphate regulon sensor histidine kinase PhoR